MEIYNWISFTKRLDGVNMAKFSGTLENILLDAEKKVPNSSDAMYYIVNTLNQNKSILTDDDIFNILSENSGEGLIQAEKNYYIDIRKSTFIVLGLMGIISGNIGIQIFDKLLEVFYHDDTPLFTRLNPEYAEPCILYEAAKQKRKGISCNNFSHECINNNLKCGCRENSQCKLEREHLDRAVERGLLKKRFIRYYYKDII